MATLDETVLVSRHAAEGVCKERLILCVTRCLVWANTFYLILLNKYLGLCPGFKVDPQRPTYWKDTVGVQTWVSRFNSK